MVKGGNLVTWEISPAGEDNITIHMQLINMETFISNDEAFLYHTYLCVVGPEFLPKLNKEHDGFAWCTFNHWPKPLHQGLRKTLQSKVNQTKLETVFKILKFLDD